MRRARAQRVAAALAAASALAAGAASAPAAAEIRRYEVVGAVALDPKAPIAAPRQAALRAALQDAVARAASDLVRQSAGKPGAGTPAEGEGKPPAGGKPAQTEGKPPEAPALPGEPTEYTVSYRITEDRGEQPALLAGGPPGSREYVVAAEVQVDADRVREALRRAGKLAGEEAPAAVGSFRVELLEIPSPALWTELRQALRRAGAESVVPLELVPGRALVEVRAPGGAERTVDRLVHTALASGYGLEALPSEGGMPRVRVREGPPPAPETGPEAAPGSAPAPDPEAVPEAPAAASEKSGTD